MPTCGVIIVTHESQLFLEKTIQSLSNQTVLPSHVVIVDSGSQDREYLTAHQQQPLPFSLHIIFQDNIGFCCANNLGTHFLTKTKTKTSAVDYILYLNPDAFLFPDFIENAMAFMEMPQYQKCAVVSGLMYGYDIHSDRPTEKYDSTGIFQTWYGAWMDRDQGKNYSTIPAYDVQSVPAICGALMFCRWQALKNVMVHGTEVFDSSFYMYKEDIDLSLRLRQAGWTLLLNPRLKAYHCRGWSREGRRATIPHKWRLLSARNELMMHWKQFSPYTVYSLLKYLAVRWLNV